MSRNQFVLLMGFFTLAGLALTAVLAYNTTGWMELVPAAIEGEDASFNWVGPVDYLFFALAVLATSIIGVIVALSSSIPLVSTIGYLMVAGSFGLLLGPTVGMYEPDSVVKVIFVTGGVTGVLTLIGAIMPESLENWRGYLFGGLCILLLGSFGVPFAGWLIPGFPIDSALSVLDWFGVILFSGYIIFDVNRAMRVPATVDNAIDCALALYLDIINLFIRLLRIMGQMKKN